MEELEAFTWYEEGGERLSFADLTEAEQRVALIAAGALLRGGRNGNAKKQNSPEQLEQPE